MKKDKIIFWITTGFIFLVEAVGNVATANAEYAKQIVYDLGYPEYFRVAMLVLKLLGAFAIIIPAVPARVKEWAYAGLFINTLFAIISYWSMKGPGDDLVFPFIVMTSLVVSYLYYHKLTTQKKLVQTRG